MIDLNLSEDVEQMKKVVHDFGMGLFRPIARKYDEQEHVYPEELASMKNMLSAGAPKKPKKDSDKKKKKDEAGGISGLSGIRGAVLLEEIVYADVGMMMSNTSGAPGNPVLEALADDEQLERFGGKITAFCLTESEVGSDSGSVNTTAYLDGDEWVLNGEKIFVTGAERCDNAIVFATLDKDAGKAGIKPFVVEKGTPGFQLVKLEKKMGLRASDTGTFLFTDCRIPKNNILGGHEVKTGSNEGFKGAMGFFDSSRPGVGIMATGVSRAALDLTKEKITEHGIDLDYHKNPNNISSTEKEYYLMEANLEAMRLLSWRAFWMLSNKEPNTLEASMCKAKGGRWATLITQKCCELLGPLGFSTKELAEKWMRDSKIMDIFEGTGQIQHLVIARKLLKISSKELK